MGSKCSKCASNKEIPDAQNFSCVGLPNQIENNIKESFNSFPSDDSLLTVDKIITKFPEKPALLAKFAEKLYEKGLISQSHECFSQLIKQDFCLSPSLSLIYSHILVQEKNFEEAIKILLKSLEVSKNEDQVHAFLSEIYAIVESNEKSLSHITEALRINDSVAEYHNAYGLCMMKQKNYQEALKHFLTAFEYDKHMAKALNNAGNAYRKLGNSEDAKKCYNAAINLVPKRKFPIALINLATSYFYTGDILTTLLYFEEALQTGSSIHKIMVTKGYHLLFKNPRTKTAIELLYKQEFIKSYSLLLEILTSDSNNPVLNYYMALVLTKLNKSNEAVLNFQKTIEYGQRPIYIDKQFVKHYVKRANKALTRINSKHPCEEIPEVDEDSENSTINIGNVQNFKVRAESLRVQQLPRKAPSASDSPENTSVEEENNRCNIT